LQVFEGPEADVLSLYTTIRDDPRHTHIGTLYATPIARPAFLKWTMGFGDLRVAGAKETVSEFL